MAFRETGVLAERIGMLRDFDTGFFTASELADRYGVSRETFYVWKRRRESGDERWFEALSRAPDSCPHATPETQISAILALRGRFPHFGPKKIRARLLMDRPNIAWPAASTIGDILKREGLIKAKPRRRKPVAQGEIVAGADTPNGEWAIDFKGWFRTLCGTRCDPLTITDTASRYLIETRIVDPTWAGVRSALERVFSEVGLPDAIRSDNGSPFGSTGAGGLSSLSVWWLRLGIEPRYIPPSSPQDNGRHERMHRTLKAETSSPAAATIKEQQARFDAFRRHYNEERPHEALDQSPPAKHWQPPRRTLPRRLQDPWYDADHEVRNVRPAGWIKWRGEIVFIGEALAGESVGLAEIETGGHIVRFCGRDLGVIGRNLRFHRFAPPRARLRSTAETKIGTDEE
jgi:transposase InsO family protein